MGTGWSIIIRLLSIILIGIALFSCYFSYTERQTLRKISRNESITNYIHIFYCLQKSANEFLFFHRYMDKNNKFLNRHSKKAYHLKIYATNFVVMHSPSNMGTLNTHPSLSILLFWNSYCTKALKKRKTEHFRIQ